MSGKILHIRQEDRSVDAELRKIVDLLNDLADRIGVPSGAIPSDTEKQMIQAITIARNIYSLAVQTREGITYSLPGLFSKINTVPARGSQYQIVVADADGNALWGDVSTVGAVTSVTGTAPVVSSGGGTPAISMAVANGSTNGYLSSTDWTTFNNKLGVADVPIIRKGTQSLTADVESTVTFSTAMSGTVHAVSLSCKDTDGIEVQVYVYSPTTTNFKAICPVNATLIWMAISNL